MFYLGDNVDYFISPSPRFEKFCANVHKMLYVLRSFIACITLLEMLLSPKKDENHICSDSFTQLIFIRTLLFVKYYANY